MPKQLQTGGDFSIPIDDKGNILRTEMYRGTGWIPNFVFTDTVSIKGYEATRSSITYKLIRSDGTTFTMMAKYFFALIQDPRFCGGKITASFTFIKRGPAFGAVHFPEQN